MRKLTFVGLLAVLSLSACKDEAFKKGEEGLEYKIISSGSGQTIKYGEYLQMHIGQFYNNGKTDSVLNDSRKMAPVVEMLDSLSLPPQFFKILKLLKKGDSLVIRTLTDSAFKKSPESMPPFFTKGHYLITTVKVLNIYSNKEQADSAKTASMAQAQEMNKKLEEEQGLKDDVIIKNFLAKNNIQAQRTAKGTYVQVIKPGTGNNLDSSVVAKISYTGKTLEGKTFDSNIDPAFNHMQPILVNMSEDPRGVGMTVIRGWTDGLKTLSKGAKAKFFIPSSLGYGSQGAGADIPPYTVLSFDIEVLDILSKAQAQGEMDAAVKKAQDDQKRFADSASKAATKK
ncbi:MAG: FKBP-type peptidyl-prolyl cis-trans isomerase [Ferruginibacter sp.]